MEKEKEEEEDNTHPNLSWISTFLWISTFSSRHQVGRKKGTTLTTALIEPDISSLKLQNVPLAGR